MALEDEILKFFGAFADSKSPKVLIVGTAVNVQDDTCDVEVDGEAKMLDVKLNVIEDTHNSKLVVYPKNNSKVLVGILSSLKKEAIVLQTTEIEKVELVIGTVKCTISSEGLKVEKGADSLKSIMADLISQIKAITVPVVSVGSPSGVPSNSAAFTTIQNRINAIIK